MPSAPIARAPKSGLENPNEDSNNRLLFSLKKQNKKKQGGKHWSGTKRKIYGRPSLHVSFAKHIVNHPKSLCKGDGQHNLINK